MRFVRPPLWTVIFSVTDRGEQRPALRRRRYDLSARARAANGASRRCRVLSEWITSASGASVLGATQSHCRGRLRIEHGFWREPTSHEPLGHQVRADRQGLSTPEFNEIMPNVRARDDGSFEIVQLDRPTATSRRRLTGRLLRRSGGYGTGARRERPINTRSSISATLSQDGAVIHRNNDLYVIDQQVDP